MARIRTIKPELPTDRTLAACSMEARYTFLLLISQADDYGLLLAEPRQLLGMLFPHDEHVTPKHLDKWLGELCTSGRIRWRVTKDGARVLEIVNWAKHQVVKNPGKPLLKHKLEPVGSTSYGKPTEDVVQPSVESGGADRERDLGKGKGTGDRPAADHAAGFEEAWAAYPKRPNNPKTRARDAWKASVKRGADPAAMHAGVIAYAAYCERQAMAPEFIKQAATFFGPKDHWLDDYGAPPARKITMYDENGEMTPEALRALRGNAA